MKFIDKLRQNDRNVYTMCEVLFGLLDINVSKKSLEAEIDKHIYFPSLLTIKDVLRKFGVESGAINKNDDSFGDFELPFITSIQKKEWGTSYFTVVKMANENIVEYYDPVNLKWTTATAENFENWDKNIILLVERLEINGEADFKKRKDEEKKERIIKTIPFFLLLVFGLFPIIYSLINSFSILFVPNLILFLLHFIGGIISFLLSWYEIDKQNPFLKEVCSGGNKINCNAVLSTKGAHFFGIEWSILGLTYFLGGVMSFLILGFGSISAASVLFLISIIVSPYILYSLYYQYKIVKQWCILCLGVQAILLLQLLVSLVLCFSNKGVLNNIDIQSTISIFLIYTLVITIGIFVFPFIKKARTGRMYENRWKRLKNNPNVFNGLLYQQPKIQNYPNHLGIVLGNHNAKTEIIKVCNPYCGPCSNAHTVLENIIKHNQNIRLRIIFMANDDEQDLKSKPVKHFMALAEVKTSDEMQHVMDDWYVNLDRDYNIFSEKYPLNEVLSKQGNKLSNMSNWCKEMKIRATPTFFINGYEMVEGYSIHDLEDIFEN